MPRVQADQASIEAVVQAGVAALVVNGLNKERVKPVLDTAIVRFEAFERLQHELSSLSDFVAIAATGPHPYPVRAKNAAMGGRVDMQAVRRQ